PGGRARRACPGRPSRRPARRRAPGARPGAAARRSRRRSSRPPSHGIDTRPPNRGRPHGRVICVRRGRLCAGRRMDSVPGALLRRQDQVVARGRVVGLAVSAFGLLVALSGCSVGKTFRGFGWPEEGVTPQAHKMYDLWIGSVVAAFVVGFLVWGLIFWCVV